MRFWMTAFVHFTRSRRYWSYQTWWKFWGSVWAYIWQLVDSLRHMLHHTCHTIHRLFAFLPYSGPVMCEIAVVAVKHHPRIVLHRFVEKAKAGDGSGLLCTTKSLIWTPNVSTLVNYECITCGHTWTPNVSTGDELQTLSKYESCNR